MDSGAPAGTGPVRWVGAAAALLIVGVLATLAAFVFFLDGDEAATDGPTPAGAEESAVTLRAGPEASAAVVITLPGDAALNVVGRSADGTWLAAAEPGEAAILGWARVADLDWNGDLVALPVVAGTALAPPAPTGNATPVGGTTLPGTALPGTVPTLTPDLPDLVLQEVFSRDNRLVVVVTNEGNADIAQAILIAVSGAEPRRIDVGKPLRPGDRLETELEGEYVQLRALVTVTASLSAETPEERTDNNARSLVIEPDVPNDIEVLEVSNDPSTGHLVVTVRNNSVIPLVGGITLAVRRTAPSTELLGRREVPLDLAPRATASYEFPELVELDLAAARVLLATDAISDADTANNVLPR